MAARLTQEHLDLVHAQETASLTASRGDKTVESNTQDTSLQSEPSEDTEVRVDVSVWCEQVRIVQQAIQPVASVFSALENAVDWHHPPSSLALLCTLQLLSALPHLIPGVALLTILLLFGFTYATKDHVPGVLLFKQLARAADAYANLRKQPQPDDVPRKLRDFSQSLLEIQRRLETVTEYCRRFAQLLTWKSPSDTRRVLSGLVLVCLAGVLLPFSLLRAYIIVSIFAPPPLRKRLQGHALWTLPDLDSTEETKPQQPDHQRLTPLRELQESEDGSDWVVLPSNVELQTHSVESSVGSDTAGSSRPSISAQGMRQRKRPDNNRCAGCRNSYSLFRGRVYCRNCGGHYCSSCCKYKVPRSVFGATAPAAKKETVRVCNRCIEQLRKIHA
eukprot:m.148091 g.148091  ORF g.148091 m.148091 type:complete len:389 (-) comp16275_c0_seq14:1233-2399(-)